MDIWDFNENKNYKMVDGYKVLNLLISTPYYLQEMQLIKDQAKIKFDGLNKPKEVHITNLQKIGEDGNLRANYRVIFLTLRDFM